MNTRLIGLAVAALALAATSAAIAQQPKSGGILRMYHRENPPSMSIHEEATYSVNVSSMPIFSNLVMYDQHKAQNSVETIVPELATSWSWSEDGKALTFKLREGVKWHDGKPFTSADVKCTFEMLSGKSQNRFRKNPRKDWFANVTDVTPKGDFEVTFNLSRPQPAILAMLASGYTPIYACHVTAAAQRTNPIGTGPFKFVELKQNESIKLVKNPDYWKKGLPYLDGIEYTIIPNRSTAILGFVAGKFDITFPTEVTIPLLKDTKAQKPDAVCVLEQTNVSTNLIINRESAPFDNADVRRAVALALDRKSFTQIMAEGNADLGGAMLPPPSGVWGMPPEELKTVIGYGDDVKKNRDEARKLMEKAGFGPNKRLALKISTRNLAIYRDPGRDPDRPAQGHLYRRRARRDRERHLVRQGRAQGIPDRPQPHRRRHRRSGPDLLRELRLRLGAQLHQLLQQGAAGAVRRADRRRRTSPSARSWCGRSTRSCRRTWRARSSITRARAPAGRPT